MSFEDLDQQINDAADKHHPVYREEAWSRMQKLLDKHLPQERKRKRRALFLLPLLLLLSAGGFYMARNFAGNNDQPLSQQAKPVSTGNASGNNELEKPNTKTGTSNGQPATSNLQPATSNPQPVTSNLQRATNPSIRNPQSAIRNSQYVKRNSQSAIRNPSSFKKITEKPRASSNNDEEQPTDAEIEAVTINEQPGEKTDDYDHEQPATTNLQPVTSNLQPEPNIHQPVNNNTTAKRQPSTARTNRFSRSFAITVNGGADLSAVRFSEPGQKRFIGGIGLQYQFFKNITVRTGFFQTHKVYAAKPKDYKSYVYTPSGYWLSGVSGDCRVFEIPVSIAYTINAGKKLNFFAAVGASSMIMKKEDYVYNYKSAYSPGYDYRHSVQNRNEHFLSSVDFSAGIQQNLNNRIFFRAEPYLRLPLHGVGVGNIKLKSAGVMLSAGIKPFGKK